MKKERKSFPQDEQEAGSIIEVLVVKFLYDFK